MGAICSAPDAVAVENAAAHHEVPRSAAEDGTVETPIPASAAQAASGSPQTLHVEEEQQALPEPQEHDACSDAAVQPACPASSADKHNAAPEQEAAGAGAERDSTSISTGSPAEDNARQADSPAADAPDQSLPHTSSCDTPSTIGDCASAGQIGPGKLCEPAESQPQDASANTSACVQQEAAEVTERCSAAAASAPLQARTSAHAPAEPQQMIHRTASNASSVISSSHVTTGVYARPSDDGSVCSSTAAPKRKQHRPSAQHLQQQQGRSKSVPRQQQLYAASGQPRAGSPYGSTGSRKDFAQSGSRRQQPSKVGAPGYGPPQQKSMPQAMKATQQYSSQSRLSKATAFAAAAVVRRSTQQPADSYTSAFPNYPDLPVLPNYPRYPTPPASVLSEEPSGQFQYDSGGESEKNLEDSVEWSELSSSLPPSCFGTARVSRVMDGVEVQQMLGVVVGPDAAAAAHRLHDLVDTPSSADSSSSGAAARPGVRTYHQPPPSLHQHIYPGCPYPLGPGSSQKAAPAGSKAPGAVQSRMAAQPQVSNAELREAAPPRVGSGGLTSVAEEHIAEDPQLSQQSSGTPEELANGAAAVQDDPVKNMRLSQLSLASLPNPSASQDILGVSDMSSMAILAK